MIIGFMGKKSSGKNTAALIVRQLLNNKIKVIETSFAYPLKNICSMLYDIPKEIVFGSEEDKNKIWTTWSAVNKSIRDKYNKQETDPMDVRTLLQLIGTNIFRENLNPNIWTDICLRNISKNEQDITIITDVRFINEMKAIQKVHGKVVRLFRHTECQNNITHPSEIEMDNIPSEDFNYIISEQDNINVATLTGAVAKILFNEGIYNYNSLIGAE